MAKLVLSLDGVIVNQFFTDQAELRIGSASDNEIAIDAPHLAAHQARILCIGEDHILENLPDDDGSLINGRRSFRQILQHRDLIEFGDYQLRYLNTKVAAELNLDRTMLIAALPLDAATSGSAVSHPSARAAKQARPEGYLRVLAGHAAQQSGDIIQLKHVVTTVGTPGEQLAAFTSRPQGFFLTHVEGPRTPRLNQQDIGNEATALKEGDQIEAAGCQLSFHLGPAGR